MQEENYTVYKHVNKTNGKVYIGITSGSPKKRWGNGRGYHGSAHFKAAIEKYGWDNFEHLIIQEGLTKTEACNLEQKLIADLDARNPEKGYNLSSGGESGALGVVQKEEDKQKRRQSCIKTWSDPELRAEQSRRLKGKKKSDDAKAHMRESAKRREAPSEEQKARISDTLKEYYSDPENRKKMSDAVPKNAVRCVDTNQVYSSSHEAARQTGVYQGNIYACCMGKRRKAGGLHWEFYNSEAC